MILVMENQYHNGQWNHKNLWKLDNQFLVRNRELLMFCMQLFGRYECV